MIVTGAAMLGLAALGCATYWAFLRPTNVVFSADLTAAVESEAFRDWLGEQPQSGDWFSGVATWKDDTIYP